MNPYSNDLRRRIVDAYEGGEHTLADVAGFLRVSLASVKNFVRRKRQTGSPDALPHAGGKKPILSEKARLFVRDAVQRDNDVTWAELRRRLQASQMRTGLRSAGARTRRGLERAIKQVRETVTKSDALAWFAHCGYRLN